MMTTMGKCNMTNRTTEYGRDVMERRNGLLDKVINKLYCNGDSNLHIQRYIKLYSHNHNNGLEHNYGKRMPGKLQKPSWPPMGKMSHPL